MAVRIVPSAIQVGLYVPTGTPAARDIPDPLHPAPTQAGVNAAYRQAAQELLARTGVSVPDHSPMLGSGDYVVAIGPERVENIPNYWVWLRWAGTPVSVYGTPYYPALYLELIPDQRAPSTYTETTTTYQYPVVTFADALVDLNLLPDMITATGRGGWFGSSFHKSNLRNFLPYILDDAGAKRFVTVGERYAPGQILVALNEAYTSFFPVEAGKILAAIPNTDIGGALDISYVISTTVTWTAPNPVPPAYTTGVHQSTEMGPGVYRVNGEFLSDGRVYVRPNGLDAAGLAIVALNLGVPAETIAERGLVDAGYGFSLAAGPQEVDTTLQSYWNERLLGRTLDANAASVLDRGLALGWTSDPTREPLLSRTLTATGSIISRAGATITIRVHLDTELSDAVGTVIARGAAAETTITLEPGANSGPLTLVAGATLGRGWKMVSRVVVDRISPQPTPAVAASAQSTYVEAGYGAA